MRLALRSLHASVHRFSLPFLGPREPGPHPRPFDALVNARRMAPRSTVLAAALTVLLALASSAAASRQLTAVACPTLTATALAKINPDLRLACFNTSESRPLSSAL